MMGHVYVIKTDSGLVKIGATRNVKSRLANIRYKDDRTAALAYDTGPIPNFGAVERLAQRNLASKANRGEWFDSEVDEAIQAVEKALLESATSDEYLSHLGRPLLNHRDRLSPVQMLVFREQHEAARLEAERRNVSISVVYREWIEKGRKRR